MIIKEFKDSYKIKKIDFSIPVNINNIKEIRKGTRVDNIHREVEIPHKPGIYIFFNNTMEIMYIGKAKDLKSRFNGHMSKAGDTKVSNAKSIYNDNIVYYSYSLCEEDELDMYEMLYSYIYKPKLQYMNIKEIKTKRII